MFGKNHSQAESIYNLQIAYNGVRTDAKIALTFDDGPNRYATQKVLNMLEQFGCAASFFVIGKWASENPDLIKKIVESNHCLGGHSYSHIIKNADGSNVKFDFEKGNAILEKLTNKIVRFIRVPGLGHKMTNSDGSFKSQELFDHPLLTSIQKNELSVIDRDVESDDWRTIDALQIVRNVVEKTKNGSIILLHDGSDRLNEQKSRPCEMLKALPRIIDILKGRGFKFVALDDMELEFKHVKI
jgi:peptidoglycan/xylan/chitin deacetylase (PgdA/CDA1 family)